MATSKARHGLVLGLMALFTAGLLGNCVQAGELNRAPGGSGERKAQLASLAKGRTVDSGAEHYVLLPQVRAVRTADPKGDAHGQLSAMGLRSAQVLERKGHYVVYRAPAGQSGAATLAATPQGQPSYPVVLNRRTEQYGVVLGTIMVKLADTAQAQAVADAHGLVLDKVFPRLGLASFKVGAGGDPFAAADTLRADPRVQRADADVLEHPKVAF